MYTERDAQHNDHRRFAALTIVLIIPVQIVIFQPVSPTRHCRRFFCRFRPKQMAGLAESRFAILPQQCITVAGISGTVCSIA